MVPGSLRASNRSGCCVMTGGQRSRRSNAAEPSSSNTSCMCPLGNPMNMVQQSSQWQHAANIAASCAVSRTPASSSMISGTSLFCNAPTSMSPVSSLGRYSTPKRSARARFFSSSSEACGWANNRAACQSLRISKCCCCFSSSSEACKQTVWTQELSGAVHPSCSSSSWYACKDSRARTAALDLPVMRRNAAVVRGQRRCKPHGSMSGGNSGSLPEACATHSDDPSQLLPRTSPSLPPITCGGFHSRPLPAGRPKRAARCSRFCCSSSVNKSCRY